MTQEQNNRVFLGLGGNLGQPRAAFIAARQRLADHPQVTVTGSSPLYRTAPVGGPAGQPDYLNAVLELTTELSPRQLLELCRELEDASGRTRDIPWGPRTLDIDLLIFGQLLAADPQLTLPHPRMHERHFVLLPLAALAPELHHPGLLKSTRELLHELPEATGVRKISEHW